MPTAKKSAISSAPAKAEDSFVAPSMLRFDMANPRFIDGQFTSEEDIIEHLVDVHDVNELVQSILSAGYLDYEPHRVDVEIFVDKDKSSVFWIPLLIIAIFTAKGLSGYYQEVILTRVGNRLVGLVRRSTDLHEHKWMYDEAGLLALFEEAGFARPAARQYLESDIPREPLQQVEREDRLCRGAGVCVEARK